MSTTVSTPKGEPAPGPGWRIGTPAHRESDGVSRVAASVAGHEVWFESPDARLEPAPEAFASAFFVQALHQRVELEVEAPVDAAWLANTRELLPIYRRWWDYPGRHPVRCVGARSLPADPGRLEGLFFSGGVDSFHSLLRLDDGIGCLVFVHGFDLDLDDTLRTSAWEKRFREIAGNVGKRAVLVRTNLRRHPLHAPPWFARTHGGTLAAVAHVLSGEISRMRVSSSYRYEREIPWGSHWETDPLWSSARTRLRHGDATLGHHQKLLEIALEPLVARHLRVCPSPSGAPGNCSRCEKCLRTMVSLEAAGALDRSAVFDRPAPLAALLDAAPPIRRRMQPIWADYLDAPLPPETREAVRRLLRRSRGHAAREGLRGAFVRRLRRLRRRLPGQRPPGR